MLVTAFAGPGIHKPALSRTGCLRPGGVTTAPHLAESGCEASPLFLVRSGSAGSDRPGFCFHVAGRLLIDGFVAKTPDQRACGFGRKGKRAALRIELDQDDSYVAKAIADDIGLGQVKAIASRDSEVHPSFRRQRSRLVPPEVLSD